MSMVKVVVVVVPAPGPNQERPGPGAVGKSTNGDSPGRVAQRW